MQCLLLAHWNVFSRKRRDKASGNVKEKVRKKKKQQKKPNTVNQKNLSVYQCLQENYAAYCADNPNDPNAILNAQLRSYKALAEQMYWAFNQQPITTVNQRSFFAAGKLLVDAGMMEVTFLNTMKSIPDRAENPGGIRLKFIDSNCKDLPSWHRTATNDDYQEKEGTKQISSITQALMKRILTTTIEKINFFIQHPQKLPEGFNEDTIVATTANPKHCGESRMLSSSKGYPFAT